MLTPEQQRQKNRLDAAKHEIRAAWDDHELHGCIPGEENYLECTICGKSKLGNDWISVVKPSPTPQQEPVQVKTEDPEEEDEYEDEEICLCPKDADGQCPSCRDGIIESCKCTIVVFTKFFEDNQKAERDFRESLSKCNASVDERCSPCTDQYIDLGISKLISGLADVEVPIAKAVMDAFKKSSISRGITAMPLTDKAWLDLCASKGWTP